MGRTIRQRSTALPVLLTLLLTVMAASGRLGAMPSFAGVRGPLWFYEEAPGVWRGDGGVRVAWESARGAVLSVQDSGRSLRITYPGSVKWPAAGLCAGVRMPVRWFSGQREHARRTAEAGECLAVEGLWAGIALRLEGDAGRLKSEYVIEPGGDPEQIRVMFEGSLSVRLAADGGLIVETSGGPWREEAPRAWTERGVAVPVSFRLHADGSVGFKVSFEAGRAPGERLIIDPAINYSGVFGGSGSSAATSMTVDGAGMVYVAGYTDAADFPMAGSILPRGGGVDGVVLKLDPATGKLSWANYIGGSGDDRVHALALGPDGGIYAAGSTTSANFPVAGPAPTAPRGGSDVFVMKFSGDGATLLFSNYLGGTQNDTALALAVVGSGVWVGGQTASTNFPVMAALQPSLKGASDGFLARFAAGGAMEYSSYLGGVGEDLIRTIAAAPGGEVVVGGSTASQDFPVPMGAAQGSLRGALDGFVLKLAASGGTITAGTFLGGGGGTSAMPERVEAVAVDSSLNVYAAGYTPSADFPTPNAWLGTMGGVREGFLVKLNPGLNSLAWGTFLGGSSQDMIHAMALLPDGRIAVGGATSSVNLPLQDPLVAGYRGSTDGFLAVFTPDGATLPFSTYMGGSSADAVFALAAVGGNSVLAAGQSGSPDLPLKGLASGPSGSALRFFVTRVVLGAAPQIDYVSPSSGSAAQAVFEVRASHPAGAAQLDWVELVLGDVLSGGMNCRTRWSRQSGQMWVVPAAGATVVSITPGGSSTSSGPACTLSGAGSSATSGGNSAAIQFSLTLNGAFAGIRTIAAGARAMDGVDSGYSAAGSWNVPAVQNGAPAVASTNFHAVSGADAVFTIAATDPNGAGDLARLRLLIGVSPAEAGSCAVEYDQAAGLLRLVNDTGTGWYSAAPGSQTTLANNFCQLRVATTLIAATPAGLQVSFDLSFSPAFAGLKTIYAFAADRSGLQTGYLPFGTYPVMSMNNTSPVFVALTPSAGGGAAQRFVLSYADSNGAADLVVLRMRIHSAPQDAGGCVLELDRRTSMLRLKDNTGGLWVSAAVGSAQPIANSQCEVRPAAAAVSVEGSQVHLSVEIGFFAAFNGSRLIWTTAEDAVGTTPGWQQTGSFSVAANVNQAPVALSVTPATGSGPTVTMTAVWTDANGAQDIRTGRVLFNSAQTAQGGCYMAFDRQTLTVSLADDTGAGWSQTAVGSGAAISNGQCTLHSSGTSFQISGSNFQVRFQISFKSSFNGAMSIWANATDLSGVTSESPWMGSFTVSVPVNQPPAVASLNPAAGSGSGQVFTVAWSDANGGADIMRGEVLMHAVQSASWACYLQVRPGAGQVALASDDGAAWLPVQAGGAASVSNSQCTLRGAGTAIQVLGTSLIAQLDLTFKAHFNGAKSIWANALDTAGLLSTTPILGAYTVSAQAAQSPVPSSVSPSAGSGTGQVFQFVWTDANGAQDITAARVLINSAQQASGGCYFLVDRQAGVITLADDGGNLSLPARMGTSDTASNSQCIVQGHGSSIQAVGMTLSAYVDIRFKPGFNGLRGIFMNATDQSGLTSPAPQMGTFDVMSSLPAAPVPVGAAPTASGSRQTFTFTWTDANGAHDIAMARVLIHSAQQAQSGCYLQIEPAAGRVLLADDAAAVSTSLNLGAAQSVQNSQCRVYGSGSWAIANGNTLTVMLDIGFLPAFAGVKSIWMNASDVGGLTSPSPQVGGYTVLP